MPTGGERIGVVGGTFDPVHIGHLVAAVNAGHALALDRVLLVVANSPWQKVGSRDVSHAEDRLAMVEAAVDGVDGLDASRMEIDRGGTTYTADTLVALAERWPRAELFLVIGADVASELDTWKRTDEIRASCTLAVVDRAGEPADIDALHAGGWRAERVTIPALHVSSTELRSRLADGRPIDYLTPAAVVRVIRERGLYADGR